MTTPKEHREAIAPSALDLALAQVVRDCREQWEGELSRMAAESRALIAELKASVLEHRLAELEAKAAATKAKAKP